MCLGVDCQGTRVSSLSTSRQTVFQIKTPTSNREELSRARHPHHFTSSVLLIISTLPGGQCLFVGLIFISQTANEVEQMHTAADHSGQASAHDGSTPPRHTYPHRAQNPATKHFLGNINSSEESGGKVIYSIRALFSTD